MTYLKWTILVVIVLAFLFVSVLYGTSKDVWEAGNSDYIPEGK